MNAGDHSWGSYGRRSGPQLDFNLNWIVTPFPIHFSRLSIIITLSYLNCSSIKICSLLHSISPLAHQQHAPWNTWGASHTVHVFKSLRNTHSLAFQLKWVEINFPISASAGNSWAVRMGASEWVSMCALYQVQRECLVCIVRGAEVIMNLIEFHLIRHYLTRMISRKVMVYASFGEGLCYFTLQLYLVLVLPHCGDGMRIEWDRVDGYTLPAHRRVITV